MNRSAVSSSPSLPPSSPALEDATLEDKYKILGNVEKQNILRMLDNRMLNAGFEIVTENLPLPFAIYAFRKERAELADFLDVADENGKSPVMICVVDGGYAIYAIAGMPMEPETDPSLKDCDMQRYVTLDKKRFPTALMSRERVMFTEREDVDMKMGHVRGMYREAEVKFFRDGKSAAHAKTLPSFAPVELTDGEDLRERVKQEALNQSRVHRKIQEIAIASRNIQDQIRQTKKSLSIAGAIIGVVLMTSGAADVGVKKTAEKARETVMMNVDDPEIAVPVLHAVTVAEETFINREKKPVTGMASDLGGGALGGALIGYGIAALAGRMRVRQFRERNRKDIPEM